MKKVSKKTRDRAFLYIRTLEALIKERRVLVSSRELAAITGLTDVQIRKDISSFGKLGTPRIGYQTSELKNALEDFVLPGIVRVVLFGVGNLGAAILKYPGFHRDKIKLVAAFDNNPKKVGKKINGVHIYSINKVPEIVKAKKARVGIIAVPADHSQEIADIMVSSGLRGVMNFSPTSVSVSEKVSVKDIDLRIEFLSLFSDIQK